jgi:hypothetical protein
MSAGEPTSLEEIQAWNEDYKRRQGVNPKDLIGAKKAPVDLVPPALLVGAAQALGDGAAKYGPYNWREYRVQSMTYLAAALRHILAFIDGEDVATDSGVLHLAHVAGCMAILLDAFGSGFIDDNRPPKGPAAKLLAAQDKSSPPAWDPEGEVVRQRQVEEFRQLTEPLSQHGQPPRQPSGFDIRDTYTKDSPYADKESRPKDDETDALSCIQDTMMQHAGPYC